MTRWPGLDGLRGVAVAAVVLFHAGLGLSVNGFVGVDVFFALSGFLITALLLRERERTGHIWLVGFYSRRVLRLYPALLTLCLGVLLLGAATARLADIGPAAVAALLYVANWWIYAGHPAPLLEHTWTLAIEEHFYLVWPCLLIGLLARRVVLRGLALGVALGIAGALLLSWPPPMSDVPSSYLRGTPIIWGAALAWVWVRRPDRAGRRPGPGWRLAGWAALSLLTTICLIPWRVPARWLEGYASLPGALTIIVIAALAIGEATPGPLTWRPVRWLGLRSYGIYLYHFPILSVLWHNLPMPLGPTVSKLIGIAVTLVLAELSYRWIETPALRLKERVRAR